MLQYRRKENDEFAQKLRSSDISTIFTTRKLRSSLPILKTKLDKNLNKGLLLDPICGL